MKMRQQGQTLVMFAISTILLTVMAMMTLSIGTRVRNKMELQTLADTAAYSDATATARAFNSMAVLNRTSVSFLVVMLGIEAQRTWASLAPAYLQAYETAALRANEYCPKSRFTNAANQFHNAWQTLVAPPYDALDQAAGQESKAARDVIVRFAQMQHDIKDQLTGSLRGQSLGSDIIGHAGNFGMSPVTLVSGEDIDYGSFANREVSGAMGESQVDHDPMLRAALGSRITYTEIGGNIDWMMRPNVVPGAPNGYQVPQRLLDLKAGICAAGNFTCNEGWPDSSSAGYQDPYQLSTSFDVGSFLANEFFLGIPNDVGRMGPLNLTDQNSVVAEAVGTAFFTVNAWPAGCPHGHPVTIPMCNFMASDPLTCDPSPKKDTITVTVHVTSRSAPNLAPADFVGHTWGDCSTAECRQLPGEYFSSPFPTPAFPAPPRVSTVTFDSTEAGAGFANHQNLGVDYVKPMPTDDPQAPQLGLLPPNIMFAFPQEKNLFGVFLVGGPGARGAFGQPKTPVLMTRPLLGVGNSDPWDLVFSVRLAGGGPGGSINLKKVLQTAALSAGMAYYHRPSPDPARAWQEPPNLLNPFWHATLVPIDQDEHPHSNQAHAQQPTTASQPWPDPTPAMDWGPAPTQPDGVSMLQHAGLTDAQQTYDALFAQGYRGIQ